MLIREKLLSIDFPASERCLVEYMLQKKTAIRPLTTKQIAEAAYASPSSLIRIAKKLGYDGWNSLKNAYCDEEEYLSTHFTEIDPNVPFVASDSLETIAAKIAAVKKEAIEDTLSLLKHDDLSLAVRMLQRSSSLQIFGVSSNALIVEEFALKMSRIQYPVHVHSLQSELVFNAALCPSSACAMIISYSGETTVLKQCLTLLKEKHIPVIVLSSLGTNSLNTQADVVLTISTREKLYSKIANYVSEESILTLLDILYSVYFAKNYDKNLALKIETSKRVEVDHYSNTSIIHEEQN